MFSNLAHKGQLIFERTFCYLWILPKNEQNNTIIVLSSKKSNLFACFLEESSTWKIHYNFVWPLEQLVDIESSRCLRATVYNTGVHSINKYYIHSTYCNNKQQMIKVQLPKIISIFYQNIKTCTLCKSGISLTIWLSKNDSKWNSKLPISRGIWGNLKNHVLCGIEYLHN